MTVLEITVQRGSGGVWPVVLEHSRPDALSPIRKEGELRLGDEEQQRLIQLELDPQAYGEVLGGALFTGRTREAFLQAKARDPDGLRVRLFVEDKEFQRLYWGRLCEPVDDEAWDFLARDQRSTFALYLPSSTDPRTGPSASGTCVRCWWSPNQMGWVPMAWPSSAPLPPWTASAWRWVRYRATYWPRCRARTGCPPWMSCPGG